MTASSPAIRHLIVAITLGWLSASVFAEPAASRAPATAEAAPATEARAHRSNCQLGFDGCYLDLDRRLRHADGVYADLMRRQRVGWLRAVFEEALALGGGTAWYWLDRERQVADWDFPSIKQRLTFEAWRFDNNSFDINWFWHPINGSLFHWIGRSNNMSLPAAVGYGFATSLLWEYVLEFREKVSVNDLIATSAAGVSFGEFLHWFGRYLGSAPTGSRGWHRPVRWALGSFRSIHNQIDGTSDRRPLSALDSLGLSSDYWHRFRLSAAMGKGSALSTERLADDQLGVMQLRLAAELVAIPGYRRAGRLRRFFREGNITRLRAELGAGNGSHRDIRADTLLLGWHQQDLPDPQSSRVGHAITVGTSLAYHYQRDELGAFRDRVALIHLPGAAVEGLYRGPGWQLELGGRLHADFIGLYALTYDRWRAEHPDAVEKTILRKQKYYYGWGASTSGWAELTTPRVHLGARLLAGSFQSQEGLDRSQEEVTDDVPVSDTLLDYEAWLRVFPSGKRWYLEGRMRHQKRSSELDGLSGDQSLRTYLLEIGVEL